MTSTDQSGGLWEWSYSWRERAARAVFPEGFEAPPNMPPPIRDATGELMFFLRTFAPTLKRMGLQQGLSEIPGKILQAKDVLAVARECIKAFDVFGLRLEGKVDDMVAYDPAHHAPRGSEESFLAGVRVRVRVPGVTYNHQVLETATVDLEESEG